jgi:hypothetical protein
LGSPPLQRYRSEPVPFSHVALKIVNTDNVTKKRKKTHRLGKDVVLLEEERMLLFCYTTRWMQRHTTSLAAGKRGKAFLERLGGWEAWACTPPGLLLRHFWQLRSMLVSYV